MTGCPKRRTQMEESRSTGFGGLVLFIKDQTNGTIPAPAIDFVSGVTGRGKLGRPVKFVHKALELPEE